MAATSPPRALTATAAGIDAARSAEGGLDGQTLLRVRRVLAQSPSLETRADTLARVATILRSIGQWDFLALVTLPQGATEPTLEGLALPTEGLTRTLQEQLLASGRQALSGRQSVTHRAQAPDGWIIATPCLPAFADSSAALVAFSTQAAALKPFSLLLLECAAQETAQAELRRKLLQSEQDLSHTAAVVELIERLSQTETLDQLDRRLVGELACLLIDCEVVLGRRRSPGGPCRLSAVSGEGLESLSPEKREALAAVMDEALIRRRQSSWPAESPEQEAGLLVHRQYVDRVGGGWLVTTPLAERDSDGAVLLVAGANAALQPHTARLLAAALQPVAAVRETVRLAQQGPFTRWRKGLLRLLSRRRLQTWLFVSIVSVAAMFVRVPHRVRCGCDLEPVLRQMVATPFAAPLEAALVRPGDEVTEGQLLARLDGREVRWELAGATADWQRASRERDGHLAEHDSGAARLSQLEMERLQMQTQLLEHRASQLEIRSPVSGLIISGDLDQVIGAPLETGQTLFEIAPIEHLLAEVKIPERDIPYAQVGQAVRYWLDSQPDEPRQGVLTRITPRAEIREGESVFIAEIEVENHAGWLRPGMHGVARIDVGTCRLGWWLFHRAWEETRVWVGL